jgi:hypothetical protein
VCRGAICISSILLFLLIVVTHHADIMTLASQVNQTIAVVPQSNGWMNGQTPAPTPKAQPTSNGVTIADKGVVGPNHRREKSSSKVGGTVREGGESNGLALPNVVEGSPVHRALKPTQRPPRIAPVTGVDVTHVNDVGGVDAKSPLTQGTTSPTAIFLPLHYQALIRLHAPVRRRLQLTSRFFREVLVSWVCVTFLLVVSGARNLHSLALDGKIIGIHYDALSQDIFFCALGSLGLALCFFLLAQLSSSWNALVDRWRQWPVLVHTPYPEVHAAWMAYVKESPTGYMILGQIIQFHHAIAVVTALVGVVIPAVLTQR